MHSGRARAAVGKQRALGAPPNEGRCGVACPRDAQEEWQGLGQLLRVSLAR